MQKEKRYGVKTRNWRCKQWVFNLISLAPHVRCDGYSDGDGKFWFESDNFLTSILVWSYWYSLSYFSGGMTYIIDQKKYPAGISKTKLFFL